MPGPRASSAVPVAIVAPWRATALDLRLLGLGLAARRMARRHRPAAEEHRAHDAQHGAARRARWRRRGSARSSPAPACVAASSIIARPRNGPNGGSAASASPATANIDPQRLEVASAAVQRHLVDRAAPVLQGADGDEQRGLDEPVADDEDGDTGKPGLAEQRDAAEQDPHVRDGGEGDKPLEVALGGAHDRRRAALWPARGRAARRAAPRRAAPTGRRTLSSTRAPRRRGRARSSPPRRAGRSTSAPRRRRRPSRSGRGRSRP